MPESCAAYGCSKTRGRDTSDVRNWLRFYKIPNDRKKQMIWAQRIKRQEKDLKTGMVVCSDHFHDKCLKNFIQVVQLIFSFYSITEFVIASQRSCPINIRTGCKLLLSDESIAWYNFTQLYTRFRVIFQAELCYRDSMHIPLIPTALPNTEPISKEIWSPSQSQDRETASRKRRRVDLGIVDELCEENHQVLKTIGMFIDFYSVSL